MENIIKGRGVIDTSKGNPFIAMFYIEDGERKIYQCNWALECIDEFQDKVDSDIEIPYFFVMGNPVAIHSIKDAIKFCNA